ncbi:MAG TPA: acyltransferase [Syntrophobacteraceae bacterium]|nr:acyltransferase [Syntrophobacteraceae bacterium]
MSTQTESSPRRYDLDWLRVLAILAVFIFHSGRFFDQMDWHVKSATVYPGAQAWTLFLVGWLMPLMFVISGASLFYAVGKGRIIGFVRDKVLRLLVPFLVGVFTHVVLAVYLERITHNQFSGSFFTFYPHYFEGMYGFGGNFAWMGLHLWYLLVLFLFTLVFLPLFYLLKGLARSLLNKLGDFLAAPGVILVLILPVVWLSAVLDPRSALGQRNFGGWPVPVYLLYLFYGFIIFSHLHLQGQIRKMRMFYLAAALVASAILFWHFGYVVPRNGTQSQWYFGLLFIVSSWCWILAFIGFIIKYLLTNGPFLKYANEAVLPFYIMHQTVLLLIGYLILDWQISDPVKWLLIALSSFALVLGLYEFAIRRFNILRILFGMKLLLNAKKW